MSSPFLSWRTDAAAGNAGITELLDAITGGDLPLRLSAYDGSRSGPHDAPLGMHITRPRGISYLASAPGPLGLARAYVSGDLTVDGVHPADPYPLLRVLQDRLEVQRPDPSTLARIVRTVGVLQMVPPPPPPQEALPDWRRALEGLRHSRRRDAEAISHHYDVSNRFYELLLGESMTYTGACYPTAEASLEEAQAYKYDLVARKLGLRPGMRLLDVGCGWGGMVRHAVQHYGVTAVGITLSREQARWGAERIAAEGLSGAEVRHGDYRSITESGFDAVSSIGLTEHIGVRNYPAYFGFLRDRLRPQGRLLNHCITRPENRHVARVRRGFIDRYVFPDGELTGSGRIITQIQNAGLEVRHAENLREHYTRTCAAWSANLLRHWDACVAEVGQPTAKVWGLYIAGCRLGFETNQIQLHQVLAVKPDADGDSAFPLRPDWGS